MSQGSLSVDSGSGAAVRAAFNAALLRLATKASGTARPLDIQAGESWIETDSPGAGIWTLWLWDGASDIKLGTINTSTHKWAADLTDSALAPRGHLAGLGMSTAGGSATFTVAAGEAADKTNVDLIKLASAMSKTTGAWAAGAGNGALDTGTIANNTWYHAHLIKDVSTGVTDLLASTSVSSPSMPSGYTLSRRIGSLKTDGSAQWVAFIQNGDNFRWVTPVYDYSGIPGVTTRQNLTLSVPTGVVVFPLLNVQATSGAGSGCTVLLTSLDETDTAPAVARNHSFVPGAISYGNSVVVDSLHTDTSGRIGRRINAADAALDIFTMGWTDRRGRDA